MAEEKQLQHLEQLRSPEPAQSTCSAAHAQDQHAPKRTVRHVIRGRPALIRDGAPTGAFSDAASQPITTQDDDDDRGSDDVTTMSVSDLRKMFSKMK